MIKLNDHYFVSWLNSVKNIKYNIMDKKIYVNISSDDYNKYLHEYNVTMKPILRNIRKIIRELNSDTR